MDILIPGIKISFYLQGRGLYLSNGQAVLSSTNVTVFNVSYSIHSGSIVKGNTLVLQDSSNPGLVLGSSSNTLSLVKCANPRGYNSACSITLIRISQNTYHMIIDSYLMISSDLKVSGFVDNQLRVFSSNFQSDAGIFELRQYQQIGFQEEIKSEPVLNNSSDNNYSIQHHQDFYKYVPTEQYDQLLQRYKTLEEDEEYKKMEKKKGKKDNKKGKKDNSKNSNKTKILSYVPASDLEKYKKHVIDQYLKTHGLGTTDNYKDNTNKLDQYKKKLVTDYIVKHPDILNNCNGCNINQHPDIHRYILKSQIPLLTGNKCLQYFKDGSQ